MQGDDYGMIISSNPRPSVLIHSIRQLMISYHIENISHNRFSSMQCFYRTDALDLVELSMLLNTTMQLHSDPKPDNASQKPTSTSSCKLLQKHPTVCMPKHMTVTLSLSNRLPVASK